MISLIYVVIICSIYLNRFLVLAQPIYICSIECEFGCSRILKPWLDIDYLCEDDEESKCNDPEFFGEFFRVSFYKNNIYQCK